MTQPPPKVETREESGDLVARHLAGDPEAFPELVRRYRAPVFSYLVRSGVAPGERDDLFQEIFFRIHRAAATYDPTRPLHPWLFTVVANSVRSHFRRLPDPTDPLPEEVDPPADDPGSEREVAGRETAALLERAIAALSPPQREVLLLVAVEELPLRDVAEALDFPLGTVKTHLRRARLRLAAALAREGLVS